MNCSKCGMDLITGERKYGCRLRPILVPITYRGGRIWYFAKWDEKTQGIKPESGMEARAARGSTNHGTPRCVNCGKELEAYAVTVSTGSR